MKKNKTFYIYNEIDSIFHMLDAYKGAGSTLDWKTLLSLIQCGMLAPVIQKQLWVYGPYLLQCKWFHRTETYC